MTFFITIKDCDIVDATYNKESFFEELSAIIDDCIESRGGFLQVELDSNAAYKIRDKDTGEWKKTAWGKRMG